MAGRKTMKFDDDIWLAYRQLADKYRMPMNSVARKLTYEISEAELTRIFVYPNLNTRKKQGNAGKVAKRR